MFQETIAEITAEHFRSHIKSYLEDITDEYSGGERVTLKVPDVDTTTMVGGLFQTEIDKFPRIGIDCINKIALPTNDDLYYCQYDGAIVGVVAASDAESVDRLSKRHARATEHFIREHQRLHLPSDPRFSIHELIWVSTSFAGAAELENDTPLWVAAFTCDVLWIVSEDQPRQHP